MQSAPGLSQIDQSRTENETGECEGAGGRKPGQTVLLTQATLQNQNVHRRVEKRYCHVQPARKKIIQLSDYDHSQWPNDNKTTWRKLARGWKTWLMLAGNLSLIQLDPTQARWMAKRYPIWTTLNTWLGVAWVGSTVWPGVNASKTFWVLWPVISLHCCFAILIEIS